MTRALRTLALPATVAAVLALSACGDGESGGSAGAGTASSPAASDSARAGAEFNSADVDFATGMIPHHRQAIEMAEMATNEATDDEVTKLATQIKVAQDPEIEALSGMLEDWGKPVPAAGDGVAGHGGHDGSMPGMMSEDEMGNLSEATGTEFDRMWAEMMIRHHEGAVEMAQTEMADGKNPEARELAQAVIDGQTAEIADLKAILERLRG
jgi:uncharacterized protein (DUF305 family)